MDNRPQHPERWSNLVVEMNDGEVKTYTIRAANSIATFLASQARETGSLIIKQRDCSVVIPIAGIRMWSIHDTDTPHEN